MSDYTVTRIDEVPDQAPKFGYAELGEARFGGKAVGAKDTGFAIHRFHPGKRSAFGHRHENAEEIAVVLEGSGRFKADDDVVDVTRHDIVRFAPSVTRAWEAGDDGLLVLVFGPSTPSDGELDDAFWPAD